MRARPMTKPFDAADFLNNEEDVANYREAAKEEAQSLSEEDAESLMRSCEDDIQRARAKWVKS